MLRARPSPVHSDNAHTISTNAFRFSTATPLLSHASAGNVLGMLAALAGSPQAGPRTRIGEYRLLVLVRRSQYKCWGDSARTAVRRIKVAQGGHPPAHVVASKQSPISFCVMTPAKVPDVAPARKRSAVVFSLRVLFVYVHRHSRRQGRM